MKKKNGNRTNSMEFPGNGAGAEAASFSSLNFRCFQRELVFLPRGVSSVVSFYFFLHIGVLGEAMGLRYDRPIAVSLFFS